MIEENVMHAWQLRGLACSVGFKPGHDEQARLRARDGLQPSESTTTEDLEGYDRHEAAGRYR
jgi:hypothetical protein